MLSEHADPFHAEDCTDVITRLYDNVLLNTTSGWSYASVPDVEECRLELDDCHDNATCVNTPTSFECVCNRGFAGDGRLYCNETCFHDCVNGR